MNNSITDSATEAVVAAAAKYGADLLADTTPDSPDSADDTLRTARNLIARLHIVPEHGVAVAAAITDIVESGEAPDRTAALRAALVAALADDRDLASDLAIFLSESGS
jgi:hypothetical protein